MALNGKHCVPCEAGAPPLTETRENRFNTLVHWELDRSGVHMIRKSFSFRDFKESMAFVNRVAAIAESEQHHPDFHVSYKKVIIELHTHAILGLSENDFILAAKIDEAAREREQW